MILCRFIYVSLYKWIEILKKKNLPSRLMGIVIYSNLK